MQTFQENFIDDIEVIDMDAQNPTEEETAAFFEPIKVNSLYGVKQEETNYLDEDESGAIEAKLVLNKIVMENMTWKIKIKVDRLLDFTLLRYHMILDLDEKPYQDSIESLKAQYDGTLFEDEERMKSSINKQIADVETDLANLKKMCERIDFTAIVEKVEHKDAGSILVIGVPDHVIDQFNRQKTRLNLYTIKLQAL